MIKATLTALRAQLLADIALAPYAGERVTIAQNSDDCMKKIKAGETFINIQLGPVENGSIPDIGDDDSERESFDLTLDYGIKSATHEGAVMGVDGGAPGIIDIHDLLVAAIKSDPTLGGVVTGIKKAPALRSEVFANRENTIYQGIAVMAITFYKDNFA